MDHYERFTINLNASQVRTEILEGREHLVVPAAMIAEGVWEGSAGAVYYSGTELNNSCSLWDNKPLVVYHPERDGRPVSACDPVVLNTRSVGRILNTKYDGKLKCEAWFDKARLTQIDNRIAKAIKDNTKVEVSTGLFVDLEKLSGKFGDKDYVGVAKNCRPDHLAILPDKTGAYSIEAGGGLLANGEMGLPERTANALIRSIENTAAPVATFVDNVLSFNQTVRKLTDLLAEKFGERGKYWEGCIIDHFPNFVMFRNSYERTNSIQMIEYIVGKDDVVSLSGSASPVQMVTEYRKSDGTTYAVNHSDETHTLILKENPVATFDRKKYIQSLVDNGKIDAVGRLEWEKLPDDLLEKIALLPVTVTNTVSTTTSPMNLQQYVANAPDPRMAEVLAQGLAVLNQRMDVMVKAILAHPQNRFIEKELRDSPVANVEAIYALLPQQSAQVGNGQNYQTLFGPNAAPITNYAGAAGVPPVTNGGVPIRTLPLPGDMFAKKS